MSYCRNLDSYALWWQDFELEALSLDGLPGEVGTSYVAPGGARPGAEPSSNEQRNDDLSNDDLGDAGGEPDLPPEFHD